MDSHCASKVRMQVRNNCLPCLFLQSLHSRVNYQSEHWKLNPISAGSYGCAVRATETEQTQTFMGKSRVKTVFLPHHIILFFPFFVTLCFHVLQRSMFYWLSVRSQNSMPSFLVVLLLREATYSFPHATHKTGYQYLFIATDRAKLSCKTF